MVGEDVYLFASNFVVICFQMLAYNIDIFYKLN